MQLANAMLSLGGDGGNQVPKFRVTAAEVAVLRAIHGDDAVTDIEILDEESKASNREELARLHEIYGNARDGENRSVVATMFPGAAARVFASFDELDLDDVFFKAKERATPKAKKAAADSPSKSLDDMTKEELLAEAKRRGVEVSSGDKKADILAAIEAAEGQGGSDDADDDGIGDMNDGILS